MKKFLLLMSLLVLSNTNIGALENKNKNEKWNLVWSEEFEGTKLDRTKWNYITGNGFWSGGSWISGWGNNEKEYYTDREKNIKVADGKLTLTALKESYKGEAAGSQTSFDYTSGKIVSKDLFNKKYGRFEFRAKLPVGKGMWAAWWMLPQEDVYGGWATSGEIDILEGFGSKPNVASGALHYGSVWPKNVNTHDKIELSTSVAEYHDYALEWLPGEIRWYVDGKLYQIQNKWYSRNGNEALNYTYPAPFDQAFYMILNVAVGGWFDGDPDKNTNFPQTMEVDYIRVYDLEGGYDENIKAPKVVNNEVIPTDIKKAVNGNLIHNGDFEKTKENWSLLSHFGGAANYSFEQIGKVRFLKADIEKGGEQTYSIQIIQDAPIIKGNWYKLSFDAKAEKDRELGIKIGGGESRGWKAYTTNTFSIGTALNSYSTMFQMNDETDLNGKVEFHGGLSTSDFWLGNVKLEIVIDPEKEIENIIKSPLMNGNLIYNGSFDQGDQKRMQFWETVGKMASFEVKDRKMNVNGNGDNAKLTQKGIQLLDNKTYSLKFKASSEKDEKINVKFMNKGEDRVYFYKEILLSKDFKEHSLKFENTTKDMEATFVVEFLGNKGKVVLDEFFLKKQVDYSNVQMVLVDENFESSSATNEWSTWSGGAYGFGGEQKYSLDKKMGAKLFVNDNGNEEWSNMFTHGVKLTKGVKYKMSFDISSSIDRDVRVVIENTSYQRAMQTLIATDKKVKNVSTEFVADRDEDATIKVLTGKIGNSKNRPHSVYIDNFRLEVVQE